jgi:hypothetical protein
MDLLTNQYLEGVYDTLLREQMKLLSDIKSGTSVNKSRDDNRQITIITSVMCNVLKLRDLKRKLTEAV